MNRRGFIKGLFGGAAAVGVASKASAEAKTSAPEVAHPGAVIQVNEKGTYNPNRRMSWEEFDHRAFIAATEGDYDESARLTDLRKRGMVEPEPRLSESVEDAIDERARFMWNAYH